MKKNKHILLILTFIFLICKLAYTQVNDYIIDEFTIEDGLSQTSIICLFQDSRGFIWAGTQDGLNRYDGYNFVIFRNQPGDPNSITYNYIRCIIEDKDGNLWIGTDFGLNKYIYEESKFQHFVADGSDPNSLMENQVFNLYEDKEGIIWIKTLHYLSSLNPETGLFRHYEHYNDVFNQNTENTNYSLAEDKAGRLWVGTKDGLNYFDRNLEIFKRYSNNPLNPESLVDNRVNKIYEDKRGNLWIGTNGGLELFDPQKEKFKHFVANPEDPNSLSDNVVQDIIDDSKGNLWVCTNNGLNKFNYSSEDFTIYRQFTLDSRKLFASSITSIIQDNSGILWIGTLQGLFKFQPNRKKFMLYSQDSSGENLFTNNYVASLFRVNKDIILVGTWGTGLYVYNRSDGQVTKISSSNSALKNDFIHVIYQDSQDNIWLGTQNGIYHFNVSTNAIKQVYNVKYSRIFKNNRIYSIEEDNSGHCWIATRYGLHNIYNDSIRSYYLDPRDSLSLSSNLVYDIEEDYQGFIWIATQNGLDRLDPVNGKMKHYKRSTADCRTCISNNEVLYIYESRLDSTLWFGTISGLNKYDRINDQFEVYTEKDGLTNNLIYAIEEDDKGNLWISTNRGLSRFKPVEEEFYNFSITDGLQNYEFNIASSYRSNDGEIFFGGISGFNSFYPDSIKINISPPKLEITLFEVVYKDERKVYNIKDREYLKLAHKNTLINIEFAALEYTDPGKNIYAYKLEGVENEWIDIGTRRYASFSNLPPGEYTFHVKGANSDLVWNEEGLEIDILVKTPVWRTKSAIVIYVVVLILMVYILIQYRTRALRKSNQELKDKERIAKQVAKQKEELTIKNKNITDSIIYAKRIQEALLPSKNLISKIIYTSFILHKPKDIVSGDFYWVNEIDDKIFIAVVDCTGHGVPGAFMSIIGFELLRKITDEKRITEADKILYELNNGIATTFVKDDDRTVKLRDGMDLALCVIDKKERILEFAGAFRPLYFIRDNKIEEIRGDRFSVGLLDEQEDEKITKTTINLLKDDIFYLFSDGYADQFGGPEGKKYKYRRFRHLLLTIHKLPFEQQKLYLDKSIEDWKGTLEQVDDILIMGIKPLGN